MCSNELQQCKRNSVFVFQKLKLTTLEWWLSLGLWEWAEWDSEGGKWSHKGNRMLITPTAVKNFPI